MATEEREALQELITEAHQVMKDLRVLLRQCQLATEILETRARAAVDEEIGTIVKESLDTYGVAMSEAINKAEQAVFARFDELGALLLGETKRAMRQGDTLEDQAAMVRKIIEERGY